MVDICLHESLSRRFRTFKSGPFDRFIGGRRNAITDNNRRGFPLNTRVPRFWFLAMVRRRQSGTPICPPRPVIFRFIEPVGYQIRRASLRRARSSAIKSNAILFVSAFINGNRSRLMANCINRDSLSLAFWRGSLSLRRRIKYLSKKLEESFIRFKWIPK